MPPRTTLWEVHRHEPGMIANDAYHRQLLTWMRGLGLDPQAIRPRWVIVRNGQHYELHVSKYVRNGRGGFVLDYAKNEAVTEPIIISLGTEKNWPEPPEPEASDALART